MLGSYQIDKKISVFILSHQFFPGAKMNQKSTVMESSNNLEIVLFKFLCNSGSDLSPLVQCLVSLLINSEKSPNSVHGKTTRFRENFNVFNTETNEIVFKP